MALLDTRFGDIWANLDTCTRMSAPGVPYTVEGTVEKGKEVFVYQTPEGRYCGADGFVVPVEFSDFIERYPDYIKAYAFKHMHRLRGIKYDPDTFEDVASELTLFILALSPGRQAYRDGKRDYIQCFDPFLQFGAKKGQFFNYINLILSNRFSSYVYNELTKDPSLNGFHLAWQDSEGETDTQESHLVAQAVATPRMTVEDQLIGDLNVEAIIAAAKAVLPAEPVEAVLRALIYFDKRSDVAAQVGMSKEAVNKLLKKIKKALGTFGPNFPDGEDEVAA